MSTYGSKQRELFFCNIYIKEHYENGVFSEPILKIELPGLCVDLAIDTKRKHSYFNKGKWWFTLAIRWFYIDVSFERWQRVSRHGDYPDAEQEPYIRSLVEKNKSY